LNFVCQVGGIPEVEEEILKDYFSKGTIRGLKSTCVKYACLASLEAFMDAGLSIGQEEVDWDMGCIYGCSAGDGDLARDIINAVDEGVPRSLGSRYIAQYMTSGPAAYLSQLFGMGNHVYSNSSACSTGTESVLMAYEKIKTGAATRMVAGSCESSSKYCWGAFDAMRVMCGKYNEDAPKASRPMSATAGGFVPGSGAATLILEELESAQARGAKIYAEIRGGAMNCGGQRNGGTMTAPNREGVQKCIQNALKDAAISADSIDLISGHLTGTYADKIEVRNWSETLQRSGADFPYINAPKSMIGHCLCAAGAIECIAALLQLQHDFVHPSLNSEDTHPEILELIDAACIPQQRVEHELDVVMKANFGFGDVNSCIVFQKTIH
ncbi:MAG: beta-ketoacyl-[acyl-carrier-protein] synthase family protein, partial [Bacteroidota bacterium]